MMAASPVPALAPASASPVTVLTECLEKPSLDDWMYRVIELPNKLQALLVHDPRTEKASAALDVAVGSFSDEAEVPGSAHCVEHVSITT
jgi:insulysin